ncbi:isocitrate lyase/PEP mutase family protein [Phormidium sp. CCY1219]|uniref:isocitrate lyase/PEP mutase family protein n=1 Tax=Phormidium sp. CCY1219 TaxID=2886104 RepID=UPI002D1EA066|nr:oxaloacetate decarboxylase [Phormidium sp. CCY1219]MEB3829514.1 oxaloacetate decarboxylase [Phormidium sp. CCY1219]
MSKAQQLRQLLDRPGLLVVPGVYDCISAQLAERVGFEMAFTSGFGISASTLGRPDYGFLTATEMLYTVQRMTQAANIPIVADLDTGYGNALNVIRSVTDAVRAGAAGVILEDQEWPKKCGHFQGKRVIPAEEQIAKIRAAVRAKSESNLVIVGRTDARAPLGLEEAIRRGRAYFEAGADIVFVEAPQSVAELQAIATALPDVPLFANMIEGGKTPVLSAQQLEELGFKIAVFPLAGLFAATKAIADCFRHLKDHQTTEGFDKLVNFQQFEKIIDVPKYRQLEREFSPLPEED